MSRYRPPKEPDLFDKAAEREKPKAAPKRPFGNGHRRAPQAKIRKMEAIRRITPF